MEARRVRKIMNDFRKLSFINTMKKKKIQIFEEESVINNSKWYSKKNNNMEKD